MAFTLTNKSRRMKVYNLDTRAMIGMRGKKKTMQKLVLRKDGSRLPARVEKMIPDSVTFCAGQKCGTFPDGKPFPDELLKVPAIAADLRKGVLRHLEVEEVKAKPSRGRK